MFQFVVGDGKGSGAQRYQPITDVQLLTPGWCYFVLDVREFCPNFESLTICGSVNVVARTRTSRENQYVPVSYMHITVVGGCKSNTKFL